MKKVVVLFIFSLCWPLTVHSTSFFPESDLKKGDIVTPAHHQVPYYAKHILSGRWMPNFFSNDSMIKGHLKASERYIVVSQKVYQGSLFDITCFRCKAPSEVFVTLVNIEDALLQLSDEGIDMDEETLIKQLDKGQLSFLKRQVVYQGKYYFSGEEPSSGVEYSLRKQ